MAVGQNLELVTRQCCVCKKVVAIRVDLDDLARWLDGRVLVQDAMPYLSPADRELLCLSNVCDVCWDLLCVDPVANPTAYS